jgi:hypothetical protein
MWNQHSGGNLPSMNLNPISTLLLNDVTVQFNQSINTIICLHWVSISTGDKVNQSILQPQKAQLLWRKGCEVHQDFLLLR